jgi:predicted RNA-binding protein with PUA-like domain
MAKHLKPFVLCPPKPGVCQECASDHPEEYPHNQNSLYYQYKFFDENGRWPTWKDAMEHCDEETKLKWSEALVKMGVKLD